MNQPSNRFGTALLAASCTFAACQSGPLHDVQDGRLLVVTQPFLPDEISHMRLYPDRAEMYFPTEEGECYTVKRYDLRRRGSTFILRKTGGVGVPREQAFTVSRKGDSLFFVVPEAQLPPFVVASPGTQLEMCG